MEPSETTRKRWPWILLTIGGAIAVACGALSAGTYVWSAVIARIGEPDQSLLFWYLPFLFIGVMGLALGLAAVVLGSNRLRHVRSDAPPPATDGGASR